ncbi:MAG: T9SS type A sorting domain-containing protein [Paludibacter sp.]
MKKLTTILLIIMCLSGFQKTVAQDIITLGVSDSIAFTLKNYTGTSSNVTVVIPAGYTSPEYSKGKSIDLSAIPAGISDLTIQGAGATKDTLLMKVFVLPSRALNSFTVKNLYMSGVNELTAGTNYTTSMGNYFMNVTTAINVSNLSVIGCSLANYRGIIRLQTGSSTVSNISFDKCVIRNIGYAGGSYNLVNPNAGSTVNSISLTNSYVYGFNGNFLPLTTIAALTSTVTIDRCVFDLMAEGKAGLYLIDYGSTAVTTGSQAVTVTNSIFGRAYSGSKGVRTSNSAAITNYSGNYATKDWYANIVSNKFTVSPYLKAAAVADTGYVANLFKSPAVYDATNYTTTVGNYSIIDATFTNGSGPSAVYNPGVSSAIIFNGSMIKLENVVDIRIFSINGLLVKYAKQVNNIYVADLLKGIYIVKAGNTVQKFIKD